LPICKFTSGPVGLLMGATLGAVGAVGAVGATGARGELNGAVGGGGV